MKKYIILLSSFVWTKQTLVHCKIINLNCTLVKLAAAAIALGTLSCRIEDAYSDKLKMTSSNTNDQLEASIHFTIDHGLLLVICIV